MPKQDAELLINTGSRTARAVKREVMDALRHHGVTLRHVHEVNRHHPLPAVIEEIRRRQPTLLVVGGGDGTISSTVDRLAGENIEFALVPLGTTNNFARSLGIPLDVAGAVEAVATGHVKAVDLGKVNDELFTNVAGIGLSARIAAHVTTAKKRRFGRLAYAVEAVRQLVQHRPFFVTLEDPDRELSLTFETRQVIIANGRFHAGRQISEDASLEDNRLIIFALGNRSLMSFLRHTIDFYVGKRRSVAHAAYFVGRHVTIRTSRPQSIELDGEVKLETPVLATVAAAAIHVRCP